MTRKDADSSNSRAEITVSLAEAYRRVRPACTAIAIARREHGNTKFFSFGSGACIHSEGIVVTAKHVVTGYFESLTGKAEVPTSPPKEIFDVIFSRRGATRFEIAVAPPIELLLHPTLDIALIRIKPFPREARMQLDPLSQGWPAFELPTEWDLNEGDSVATAGFPLRSWDNQNPFPNLFSGVISQLGGQFIDEKFTVTQLVVDMSIHPGNSGGPVFDVKTGKLVGIVSSQTLRDLDVVSLAKASQSMNTSEKDEEQEGRVWTNIIQCVPWPAISEVVKEMQRHVRGVD